jgi:DNA-binding NtrC family response regulator
MGRYFQSNCRYTSIAVPSTQPQPASGQTILLAEDDLSLLSLKHEILRSAGYRVHGFTSAEEALEFFQHNESIDLLLADVHLSQAQTGVDLAESVVAIRPGLPILLISGGILNDAQLWKIQTHRWTFVRKPVGVSQLLCTIDSLLHPHRDPAGTSSHGQRTDTSAQARSEA